MKVPLSLLKEFLDFELTAVQVAEKLTLLGLEVENIEQKPLSFSGVVVGKVLSAARHPQAERLQVATVSDGHETFQVVCGAANCREGLVTAFAKIGASLTDKEGKAWKIKRSKIREVESWGMLCAEDELGLASSSEGIVELPAQWPLGKDLAFFYQDPVLDISLTPNLGHCLSILGVARELAASLQQKEAVAKLLCSEESMIVRPFASGGYAATVHSTKPTPGGLVEEKGHKGPQKGDFNGQMSFTTASKVKLPSFSLQETASFKISENSSVKVEAPDLCPRYCARLIRNVKVGTSPAWLIQKLEACGLRSVNNIVDVGNLVLLKLGIPLHIFDARKIEGGKLVVTTDTPSSSLITLDGKERLIPPGALLITDDQKPLAFAGIIGGENSAVTEETTSLFIEGAHFSPASIRKTSRQLSLKTDASYRFDRGVDREMIPFALDLAAFFIQQVAGGEIAEGRIDIQAAPFKKKEIACSLSRLNGLLGTAFNQNEISSLLHHLEISCHPSGEETFVAVVPSYRNDLAIEADIAEEIARLFGYNNLPKKAPYYPSSSLKDAPIYVFEKEVEKTLLQEGLQQCITCDLISPQQAELVHESTFPKEATLAVLHPSSVDQSVLRTSLLPGLLTVVKHNFNQQTKDLHLFEIGKIHFKEKEEFKEQLSAAVVLTGLNAPWHWDQKPNLVDFYDLKGVLENLFAALHLPALAFEPSHLHTLHPWRQAVLKAGDVVLGVAGEIHPHLTQKLDIDARLFFAEFNLHALFPLQKKEKKAQELPSFPGSSRDVTLTLQAHTPFAKIFHILQSFPSRLLEKYALIDLFQSEKLGADKKNITLRFFYRDLEKTISQESVDKEHARLLQMLEQKLLFQ